MPMPVHKVDIKQDISNKGHLLKEVHNAANYTQKTEIKPPAPQKKTLHNQWAFFPPMLRYPSVSSPVLPVECPADANAQSSRHNPPRPSGPTEVHVGLVSSHWRFQSVKIKVAHLLLPVWPAPCRNVKRRTGLLARPGPVLQGHAELLRSPVPSLH